MVNSRSTIKKVCAIIQEECIEQANLSSYTNYYTHGFMKCALWNNCFVDPFTSCVADVFATLHTTNLATLHANLEILNVLATDP